MNKDKDANLHEKDSCYKCKRSFKDLMKLSCNHNYCQRCLCKSLLKKHLMEIPDKDSISFVCKCKRNIVMYIIKKVYESYYEDFKNFNSGNTSLFLIKYLSKPYSEFSELSFKSDLDEICEKINKLNNTLKNEDIGNSIKISYAYFSKKELTLTTSLKKAFNDQIHDIIELKDERIIACSEDKTIKIFEKNGNPQFILKGHTSGVRALCLLKNDRFASGSADKTVRIWGLKHQKTIKVLKDQSNPIISLTLLLGDKLASCSLREILIYDEHFAVKYKLTEHQNWVRGFVLMDKNRYASCSDDGLIKIYDKHFRTLYNLKEHNESVMSICCLRDGRIVSGDKAGKIILWYKNFSNNKEIKEHSDAVMHIIQLKDGRVVTCSADKTIKVWDLDFRCLFTYKNHKGSVNRLVSLRDGGFGSAGADCLLNFWR